MKPVPFSIPFEFNGKNYSCEITPLRTNWNGSQHTFQVTLNDVYFGIITFTGNSWESDTRKNNLVDKIGSVIQEMSLVNSEWAMVDEVKSEKW